MPSGVYERTEGHNKNISKALSGEGNPMYGKKQSLEARQKMSKNLQKRWAKMNKKEKLEYLKPWLLAGQKAPRTLKTRQKMAKTLKRRFAKMTKEEKRKYMKPCYKAAQILGVRQKQSRTLKEHYTNMTKEEKLNHMLPAIKASQEANPSSIEKIIWKALDKLNINYKIQVSFNNGKFISDIYIPTRRLIIECNGDYWHNLPKRRERDKALEKYAGKKGYKIVWLWESAIRKNPKRALRNVFKTESEMKNK